MQFGKAICMTDDAPDPTIDINYLKSGDYREVSCDGAVGGPTPSEKIWIGFYTERLPVARVVRHKLLPIEGTEEFILDPNSEPVTIDSRAGVIRNLEFGLYLTQDTAKHLHEWLGKQIKINEGD
jgi:hypothetical protein